MNDPAPSSSKPESSKSASAKSGPANAKPDHRESRDNNLPAMAGLAIAVVLLVVGLWLARELRAASKMQDCVMSGRTNCNVIEP
jgi:hypothetical protein